MHIFKEITPLRAYLRQHHSHHSSLGLVPTMGALHAGHLSLIQASKKENDTTICSIYVNPAQFNNPRDLEKYPRTLETDIQRLLEGGCDAVFCPDNSEMYPETSHLVFDFGLLDKILEGEFRPRHFSAVALVVSKLFHIVQPDRAYFGQKDLQQFKIISRLVAELTFNVKVVCVPIVREGDDLAMSSRNMRLSGEERKQARVLYQSLVNVREGLLQGKPFAGLREEAIELCKQNGAKVEYLSLADREDLTLLENVTHPENAVLLIAAEVGPVRLIDNVYLVREKSL